MRQGHHCRLLPHLWPKHDADGEFTDELSRQTSRFFTFRLGAFIALVTIAKTQSGKNLLCEQIEQFFYIDTDMVVDSAAVDC